MNRGFTLIELVMVIVLLGILAVFVAPRLPDVTSTNAAAFTDKLQADIRYTQNLAMTGNLRGRVTFTPGSYSITSGSAANPCTFVPSTDPATGGSPFLVTLSTGMTLALTPSAVYCLEYDSLGRPFDFSGLGNVCSTSSLAALTITVNANAVAAGSVVISAETGAVNY